MIANRPAAIIALVKVGALVNRILITRTLRSGRSLTATGAARPTARSAHRPPRRSVVRGKGRPVLSPARIAVAGQNSARFGRRLVPIPVEVRLGPVLGVMKSVSRIWALLAPPASSAMICRSRGDRGASGLSELRPTPGGPPERARWSQSPALRRAVLQGDGIGLAQRGRPCSYWWALERGPRPVPRAAGRGPQFAVSILSYRRPVRPPRTGGRRRHAGWPRRRGRGPRRPRARGRAARRAPKSSRWWRASVKNAGEQAARAGGIGVHQMGEPEVQFGGGRTGAGSRGHWRPRARLAGRPGQP